MINYSFLHSNNHIQIIIMKFVVNVSICINKNWKNIMSFAQLELAVLEYQIMNMHLSL